MRKKKKIKIRGLKQSTPVITEFGRKIGYAMAERDLSLAELSRRAGVSRPAIYHMRITKNPGGRTLHKIAKALDVPVSFFFEEGFGGIQSYYEPGNL